MLSKMPGKNEIRASMLMTFLAGPQSFVAQSRRPSKTSRTSSTRVGAAESQS